MQDEVENLTAEALAKERSAPLEAEWLEKMSFTLRLDESWKFRVDAELFICLTSHADKIGVYDAAISQIDHYDANTICPIEIRNRGDLLDLLRLLSQRGERR